MPPLLITTDNLKSLKPPRSGYEIYCDEEDRGFGVRITSSGAISFVLAYTCNRRERRITIGRWPEISLAKARADVVRVRERIDAGIDPLTQKQQRAL